MYFQVGLATLTRYLLSSRRLHTGKGTTLLRPGPNWISHRSLIELIAAPNWFHYARLTCAARSFPPRPPHSSSAAPRGARRRRASEHKLPQGYIINMPIDYRNFASPVRVLHIRAMTPA